MPHKVQELSEELAIHTMLAEGWELTEGVADFGFGVFRAYNQAEVFIVSGRLDVDVTAAREAANYWNSCQPWPTVVVSETGALSVETATYWPEGAQVEQLRPQLGHTVAGAAAFVRTLERF